MPRDLLAETVKRQPRDLLAPSLNVEVEQPGAGVQSANLAPGFSFTPAKPDWQPATLLPLEINQATGERRLAVPGALQQVTSNIETAMADPTSPEGMRSAVELGLVFSPSPAGKMKFAAAPAKPPRGAVAQSAADIGVEMPRAALGGSVQQNVARRLSDIPVVGAPLERASRAAIEQTGQAATRVAEGFGSGSVPRAGQAAREGITDYIKNVSQKGVSRQYDKVDEFVDPGVVTSLTATRDMALNINKARTSAAQKPSAAVALVDEAIKRNGLTYEGIKQLRTSIGEMMDSGPLPADISGSELKRIYAALTKDLRESVMAAGGPKALAAFERANKYSALVAANREKLASVLGAKSDEAIVDRILASAGSTSRADIKLLSRAKKALDNETWGEIASASLSRMGRDPSGQFSPDRFVTAWGKMTPQGKALLFGGRSDLYRSLNDIAAVSSRFKELNRYANPSGTGGTLMTSGALFGFAVDPLTAATALVSGRVMAHILSRPATARSVSRWVKQAERVTEQSGNADALRNYRTATRALAVSIATELGVPDQIDRIEKELGSVTLPGNMGA